MNGYPIIETFQILVRHIILDIGTFIIRLE